MGIYFFSQVGECKLVLAMASVIYHLLLLTALPPYLSKAQIDGNIPVGATLTAGPKEASIWQSPSGDFAFGFRQLEDNDHFLLSVWFDKIPEKTIVWYANGDTPAPSGSKVELTANRGLVLKDPLGTELWRSNITTGQVASGVMNNTGNFMLQSNNSTSLWETFNDPTDTLLPSQDMGTGGVLFSRRMETDFSRGRFELRFLDNGNLVLATVNSLTNSVYGAYYVSGTYDPASRENSGYLLSFNDAGALYILRRNGSASFLTTVTARGFYQRATLSSDGVFAQYSYPKTGSGNWAIIWSIPDNICLDINGSLGSGACGYNSVCSLDDIRRPKCACPQGFSLLDLNDEYGSCKPDFELSCKEDKPSSMEDLYGLVELNNTDWPTSDYAQFRPFSEEECKNSCLQDCLCEVAIFRDNSCWKKKLPLSNGRVSSSIGGKAFIKIKKGAHDRNSRNRRHILFITGSVLLSSSVFINFIFIAAFCIGFFFIYQKKVAETRQRKIGVGTTVRCFTYKELAEATNNFKEELGRGAFGVVYKGMIKVGSAMVLVAIKELDSVVQDGEKEFRTEVNVIGQTNHKNLVQLLGFCDEGQHRLLVYEYVSNGTLAEIIFGNSRPSWSQRTQILCGIARGLLYLHEECTTPIIHCDIKPQNILLDDNCNARISDFGLAKLLIMDQSQTRTAIRGTRGYMAPEWFRRTPITVKVDVYSFGVMLLEIICCRRCINAEIDGEEAILIDWAYDCYRNGTLNVLVEDDTEAINNIWKLERLVKVAIWCIQEDPSLRPAMSKITQMVEGFVEVPAPPYPFSFSISC